MDKLELSAYRAGLSEIVRLNFDFAGAMVDVNKLIASGWIDLTGVCSEGEFLRFGSTWIESVHKIKDIEYHVSCSLGQSLTGEKEKINDGYDYALVPLKDLERAHKGEVPRFGWVRRLEVWAFDEKGMSFVLKDEDVPSGIFDSTRQQFVDAVAKSSADFAEDLALQVHGCDSFLKDFSTTSPVENDLSKLLTILDKEMRRWNYRSIYRLLVPFARAVLTTKDSKGLKLAMSIREPRIFDLLVHYAMISNCPEAAVAVIVVLSERKVTGLGWRTWSDLYKVALRVRMPRTASEAMRRAYEAIGIADDKAIKEMGTVAYREAMRYFRKAGNKEKAAVERVLIDEFAKHMETMTDPAEVAIFEKLVRCRIAELEGGSMDSDRDALCVLFMDAIGKFDSEHKKEIKEKPWMKDIPGGVKAPLAWQSCLSAAICNPQAALNVFPEPMLSSARTFAFLPPLEAVEGLSCRDVWSGFVGGEWTDEIYKSWLENVVRELNPKVEECTSSPEKLWVAKIHRQEKFKVLEPAHPEAAEVMSMAVAGVGDDGKELILETFPFLPKEFPGNKTNVVVRPWRYYSWACGQAADVLVTLESGKSLTAVMPYFCADRQYFIRGMRLNAVLVGFAYSLRKIPPPKIPDPIKIKTGPLAEEHGGPFDLHFGEGFFDWFEQEQYPEVISRGGFGMQGRVVSIRELEALGKRLLAVEIDCKKLDDPLRVYIAADVIKGKLSVGDTIESFGWLYLDVYDFVDTAKEYEAKYPNGAPDEPLDGEFAGIPCFIRTEYSEDERKKFPAGMREPRWWDYGEEKLRILKGVDCVKAVSFNPQHIEYLVRRNGAVEKYGMVLLTDDEKLRTVAPAAKLFVLRREKVPGGYNIKWEGLPNDADMV